MDKEFEVEVIYRQRAIFRLQAPDGETAERRAIERWQDGGAGDVPGYDWSEIEAVRASDGASAERCVQDTELVLRYLRERERLLLRLGGDPFSPGSNDAISADRVAADLGWQRPATGAGSGPDTPRATCALEALADQHRVICFERPRVRAGERGEIRLYCTPEYLEALSASVDALMEQAI